MAVERQMSLGSFTAHFEDQLKCGICLGEYTDPKILPCYHSFCVDCIDRIPTEMQGGQYRFSCPTCREQHQLPKGGARHLPTSFNINGLLDLKQKLLGKYKPMQQAQPTPSAVVNPDRLMCPKHNDPIKVYCETCCQVICRDCTISTEHNKHTFYLISECYPKHHQQIQDSLEVVKRKMAEVNTATINLITVEKDVLKHGQNLKEQINKHAERLIDNIRDSQSDLIQQVDRVVKLKSQTLTTQREQVTKLHEQLKACQDTIEHSLNEWAQAEVLTQKQAIIDEATQLVESIDLALYKPIENVDINFCKHEKPTSNVIGEITSSTFDKATLKALLSSIGKPSTATLILQSQNGSPFSLPPSLISCGISSDKTSMKKCPITQTQPGKYSIIFTPSTMNDRLIVQVGGVDVPDSPFTLPVIPTPELKGKPIDNITGLNEPHGIAVCNNGDIVVAEYKAHSIAIFKHDGTKKRIIGKSQTPGQVKFRYPRGVAISIDGQILATDNHQLQRFKADGTLLKKIGMSRERGWGSLQFDYPAGIAVHPTTGMVFVADTGNNRIQVFSNSLNYSHTINAGVDYQLNQPHDIALDSDSNLYIADWGNHCIAKLTGTGDYIDCFGAEGSSPGLLLSPSSIAIQDKVLYVSEEGNQRLTVFATDGSFIQVFKGDSGGFNCVRGLAVDLVRGKLYVSVSGGNEVIVYAYQ